MKTIVSTVVIMSLGFAAALDAQLRRGVSEQERASVVEKVNAMFGAGKYDPYSIDVMNVDSAVDPNEPLGVEDPHHLLEHCYVFLAVGKMQPDGSYPGGFVGVYKDGNIAWHSPAIINSEIVANAEINTIFDLNKDGKPDIVTDWEEGMHGEADYLWIFSWDGHQGTPLNLWDSTGHSNLVSYTDEDHFVDLKGNGVLEIQGEWQTDDIVARDISVLYAWNGKNYISVDTSSFASVGAPPRNEVHATVHAGVKRLNDSLYFSYVIENKKSSLQKVETFAVTRGTESISCVSGRAEWGFDVWAKQPLLSWGDDFLYNLLPQGERDIFRISSAALPKIEPFYIQGYNTSGSLSDIFTKSFHGYTLGPADPPSPFVLLNFLDTLASYKHQCVALGWLRDDKSREHECEEMMKGGNWYRKEEVGKIGSWEADESWDFDHDWSNGIVGVLDKRLEKTKQALTRGDSVGARRDLQIFVMEVELVNRLGEKEETRSQKPEIRGQKPVMTSEAYALLKYNAEYLIDRLPERHGRGEKEKR